MANWIIQDFGTGYGSSSSSSSHSFAEGTVVWGNIEAPLQMSFNLTYEFEGPYGAEIEEDFARQFSGNWELINITIDGQGNSERLVLGQPGYAISEAWKPGVGEFHIFQNKYGEGSGRLDLPDLDYRTAATYNELLVTEWTNLTGRNIMSLGFVQVRLTIGASVSSSSSCRSSSSSSSSSSSKSSSSSCRSSSSSSSSSSCLSSSSSSSSSSYAIYFTFDEIIPPGAISPDYFSGYDIDNDGSHLIVTNTKRIYLSTDGGSNWTEPRPVGDLDRPWTNVALDGDGSNILAVSYYGDSGTVFGRVYTSSDGGQNWTERRPEGNVDKNWATCCSDDDGSFLMVGQTNYSAGTNLYKSSDGGANWQLVNPGAHGTWNVAVCDSDGSHIIVTCYTHVYISTDFGATWNDRAPANIGDCWKIYMNSDGSLMGLAKSNGVTVYTSTDYGVTWVEKTVHVTADPTSFSLGNLLINESDPTDMIITNDTTFGVTGFYMKASQDSGNTWSNLGVMRYSSFKSDRNLQKIFGMMRPTNGDYIGTLYIGRRGT